MYYKSLLQNKEILRWLLYAILTQHISKSVQIM